MGICTIENLRDPRAWGAEPEVRKKKFEDLVTKHRVNFLTIKVLKKIMHFDELMKEGMESEDNMSSSYSESDISDSFISDLNL